MVDSKAAAGSSHRHWGRGKRNRDATKHESVRLPVGCSWGSDPLHRLPCQLWRGPERVVLRRGLTDCLEEERQLRHGLAGAGERTWPGVGSRTSFLLLEGLEQFSCQIGWSQWSTSKRRHQHFGIEFATRNLRGGKCPPVIPAAWQSGRWGK